MSPVILLALLFVSLGSTAQHSIDDVTGTWHGSSICQIKISPCHDEVVLYHITRNTKGDSCITQANKIVNGVEDNMGTLHFVYEKEKSKIASTDYGLWTFSIAGKKMNGTLYVKGNLYRIIELSKTDDR